MKADIQRFKLQTPAPEISIQALCHRYEGRQVLKDFDLEVSGGELLVLLGPSGCGKSTLLRLIAGLMTPTSGQITIDTPAEKIGFVFQDASLLPWRTALANVALPLEISGTEKVRALEEARSLLVDVGLESFMHHYPNELSGGMRMRVSIARALSGDPSLLLLDEPFGALDEFTRRRLDDHLAGLTLRRPITTLMVTHSIEEALLLADRIIVMTGTQGKIALAECISGGRGRAPDRLHEAELRALSERISAALQSPVDPL